MIIHEAPNGVVRVVTSRDELQSVLDGWDDDTPEVEFEEPTGQRTIIFVEEVEADVVDTDTDPRWSAPDAPTMAEEFERAGVLVGKRVRLAGEPGVLVHVQHRPGVDVEVTVTHPSDAPKHPMEQPCTRTGSSLDLVAEQ